MPEGHVMPKSVFLQGLGVDNSDFQPPHHRDAPHHHLVTLEPWVQQLGEIGLVAEGPTM